MKPGEDLWDVKLGEDLWDVKLGRAPMISAANFGKVCCSFCGGLRIYETLTPAIELIWNDNYNKIKAD